MERGFTVTPYRRAGSPFWWARAYLEGEGGRDRRFSTGVLVGSRPRQSEREAQKMADQRAAALAASLGHQVAAESSSALSSVSERMLRQKTADRRRERAVDALAFNLDKHVIPFFGGSRCVTTIRRRDLEAFKQHLALATHGKGARYSPVSINNALTAIRQTLEYACEVEELLDAVPTVRNLPVPNESKGRALSPAELKRFFSSFDESAREAEDFFLFLANTGLRKTEALAIRWSWVDWQARAIRIPAEVRKGGKPQKAPTQMNSVVMRLLRARQKRREQPTFGRVWFQQKHDEARRSAAERAGLGRVRGHDLRHTYSSRVQALGAGPAEARDLLGHATLAMVGRYGHSYQERLRKLAQRAKVEK